MLDGVFATIIRPNQKTYFDFSRPYGVRPLYICHYKNGGIGFCSDISLLFTKILNIEQFTRNLPYIDLDVLSGKYIKCHNRYFSCKAMMQNTQKVISSH